MAAAGTTVIDWSAAVKAGQRLVPTGPQVSPGEASSAVADLRAFSAKAELTVRDTTDLGHGLPVADALVVDRRMWIEATAEGMALLTEPLAGKLAAQVSAAPRVAGAAGSQLGVVLAFLSSRVLGQYDPLAGGGRLLLVAPNIIKVERELRANPADFRMWVCLHESTHRLQFNAVPWLKSHFRGLVAEFGDKADLDLAAGMRRAVGAIKGGPGGSWIENVQSPEQREIFDRMMALMTLLEGHADYVMDAVGPAVIPTVAKIRAGFSERRRKGRGPVDRLFRALLGMDVKLAQYVKGAAFVTAVVDKTGMDGFNQVWTGPETLPTRVETTDPDAWIRRVLG